MRLKIVWTSFVFFTLSVFSIYNVSNNYILRFAFKLWLKIPIIGVYLFDRAVVLIADMAHKICKLWSQRTDQISR